MCGIAGWYRRGGKPVPLDAVTGQCDALRQRGPDDAGYLIDRDFGFGMRRLSIIDVEGGRQPIASPDSRYAIVFNGEIANHLELRREIGDAYPFRTRSDTETILAAYLRWGDEAWLRLDGMYTIAIWDRLTRRLCLVRDPLGIKPLYFTEQHGGFAFGSDITALRALQDHSFTLNEDGVDDYFNFGHVLAPRTIFKEVRPLDPGHVLHIGPIGEMVVRRFWRPEVQVEHGLSEQEWVARTRTELVGTVERHMLSDVPVGAFVSGGVDSGAIAAAMARTSSAPFKIFTAGFPGSNRDETAAAARVAAHLGCEHIVLPMQPQTAEDVLPKVQAAFDEPTAANSAIPLWYLSQTAAEHVKVVLCGEGGDELFLGYNRHRWYDRMARWKWFVEATGRGRWVDYLPKLPIRKWNYVRQLATKFRNGALLDNGYERFFAAVSISSPELRARMYAPAFHDREIDRDTYSARAQAYFPSDERQKLSNLEEFMLGDLTIHMPASLLQRLDRATMAHSLEARVPFLSHRFVDFALTVPASLKLRNGTGKYILRRAVEPWLPAGSLNGRKIGFQLPLADWFMGGFNDFAREAWRSSGASELGLLDNAGVEQLFDEHRSGLADHGRMLYAIAMFSCWWKEQRPIAAARGRIGATSSGRKTARASK